jgi:RNA polymerase sigma-70 factor (ECF subfamily)
VYKSRDSYEPSAKFTTWLFRIATHLALNWLRDRKYEKNNESLDMDLDDGLYRQVPDRKPTVEEILLREARFQEIRGAIGLLPGKQRAAVVMHKYQELEYSQIASRLGCTDSAVKSLLFRAYESLRSQLAHMAATPQAKLPAAYCHSKCVAAAPTFLSPAP